MPKRGFRARATSASPAGYPSLDELSKKARRRLLAGLGAAAMLSAGTAAGCVGDTTGGDPAIPDLSDAGTDAAETAPDTGVVAPGADAGARDGGFEPSDAEMLAGVPPLQDDAGEP